jgi:hypothetical protein
MSRNSKKKIRKGDRKNLIVKTTANLIADKKKADIIMAAPEFPTKKVPIAKVFAMTGQNCQDGNIDMCQNFASCAKCIDKSRIETAVDKKIIVGAKEIIDAQAYVQHSKRIEHIARSSHM